MSRQYYFSIEVFRIEHEHVRILAQNTYEK